MEYAAGVLRRHEHNIGTLHLTKGLTSNEVLAVIRDDLVAIGFEVEAGKQKEDKSSGRCSSARTACPHSSPEIDAYHPGWRCGLEVEAGRAWMGNAVYRDLV